MGFLRACRIVGSMEHKARVHALEPILYRGKLRRTQLDQAILLEYTEPPLISSL